MTASIERVLSDLMFLKDKTDRKWGRFILRTCAASKVLEEAGGLGVALTMPEDPVAHGLPPGVDFDEWRRERIYAEAIDVANVAIRIAQEFGRAHNDGR